MRLQRVTGFVSGTLRLSVLPHQAENLTNPSYPPPTISQGIVGGLKNIVGGRIGAYTEMCEQTRDQAYQEMTRHAQDLGANAIVGIRYDASEVVTQATEVLCYGTAVNIVPKV